MPMAILESGYAIDIKNISLYYNETLKFFKF